MYIIGTVILSFMFLSMQHVIDAWYMFKSTISNTECTVFDILRCPELTNQPWINKICIFYAQLL